jgi:hypothetical protein
LQASKRSLSTNIRLLTEMGLIERVSSAKPCEVALQFKAGGWVVFMGMRLMALLHQIAEQGLELLQHEPPALRERLQEAHDMFSRIEKELPALLKRVENERGLR